MSQFTKKAIVETFLELLKEHSLDKITVKDMLRNVASIVIRSTIIIRTYMI